MVKFTIDDLLKERKLGPIDKTSTWDDVRNFFGEPDIPHSKYRKRARIYFWQYAYFIFYFTVKLKKLSAIDLSFAKYLIYSPYEDWDVKKIINHSPFRTLFKDYKLYKNMSTVEVLEHLKNIGFNCVINNYYWQTETTSVYSPENDLPFTMGNPRFLLMIDKEEDRIENIEIPFIKQKPE